jgi:drug/metabolite transporter (DMT)-like permease
MKTLGTYSACGLLSLLYASFAMVTPTTLSRIDPLVFTALQMVLLLPFAGVVTWQRRASLSRSILVYACLVGLCLGCGFLLLTLALRAIGITESAILSCANGVLAALVGWKVFHQRLNRFTWVACGCAFGGAIIIGLSVPVRWQGDLIAFCGGSLFVLATFLWEQFITHQKQKVAQVYWLMFGCQFLIMTGIALLVALCFGDWHTLTRWCSTDTAVLLYASFGTMLAPILLSAWIQHRLRVSAVTIAFFAVFEPVTSATFAFFAGERLTLFTYIGGIWVVASLILQAIAGLTCQEQRGKKQPLAFSSEAISDL